MSHRMRLMDLADHTPVEREGYLAALLADARDGAPESVSTLNARIRTYEVRYEMTSTELLAKLATGAVRETAEIAKWLMLLAARDCRVSA